MIKFANMSIVLSASGKTKTLMICSLVSLVANAGCNVLFYHVFGFIGPAIATVFVTVVLTAVLAEMSAKSLETSVWKLVDWKEFFAFVIELSVVGVICFIAKRTMEAAAVSPIIILCLLGGVYIAGILCLNKKKIFSAMKEIDALH